MLSLFHHFRRLNVLLLFSEHHEPCSSDPPRINPTASVHSAVSEVEHLQSGAWLPFTTTRAHLWLVTVTRVLMGFPLG